MLAAWIWTPPLWALPATVERLSGLVEKREAGSLEWARVMPREKVAEGATLRTGPNASAQLLTPRGHRLTLRSETTLEMTSIQDDDTQARLERGRVLSKVKHLKGPEKFIVKTPTAVCAVRGTEFDTTTGPRGTLVAVYRGIVGVAALGTDHETALRAGEMTSVHDGTIEKPRPIPRENRTVTESPLAREARHEVGLDMTRNEIMAAAALEQRMAEYQEGKSLVDVNGKRVRVDEYIVRPRADQFKFVVLNQRAQEQLDYFFYQGTFNKNLPADLSVALRDLSGRVGSAPDYYLTSYEMGQSNTLDSVHDQASGGHLVEVTVKNDGTFDITDGVTTRNVEAAALQLDGTYKIYNPLSDSYSTVTAAQREAATTLGVYIPENETFRDLAPGDTVWKTRFNSYSHELNHATKISYTKSGVNDVLVAALDATWTYAGGFVLPVTEVDANNVDVTITNYYGDGTFEKYRTVLIDDQGLPAPLSAFAGISTGSAYKNELLKWNYEQQVEASEFEGRKIDLVVEPKIFINSGLIQ